jgi:hypothetical protein
VRVLLDECVPRRLGQELTGHQVRTVFEMGWSGTKDGPLLRRAHVAFDVFLTVDQGIQYQQNLSGLDLAVIVLAGKSNDIDDLRPLMPEARRILDGLSAGQLVKVLGP